MLNILFMQLFKKRNVALPTPDEDETGSDIQEPYVSSTNQYSVRSLMDGWMSCGFTTFSHIKLFDG